MKKLSTYLYNAGGLLVLLALTTPLFAQQVTGLNNWTLMIDPGHSRKENMGLFNYSEAEKVLRVSWALRDMFVQQTDIEAVYLTRDNDVDEVSLSARTDMANQLGVDFFYSVHSDAGASTTNSTLMLYGGWRSNGVTVEKTPNGGRALGEILNADLSGTMRIPTRGNFADRVFYLGEVQNHDNQFPYLFVNRTSNMASLLSEGGFHTNPRQQQLNMNAQWKVMEALSAFRSILEFRQVNRPAIGVVAGIITDVETGLPINGATVTLGELAYTTDNYESVFSQYSTDPEALRNGFYFLDGLTPTSEVTVSYSAPQYSSQEATFALVSQPNGRTAQNITFRDVQLASTKPAVVVSVAPEQQLAELSPGTPLEVKFSRKMDRESVEAAISFAPEATFTISWIDDFTLSVNTTELEYLTEYTLQIAGDVAKNLLTGQYLDGNGDGAEGGHFTVVISTTDLDITPPALEDRYPLANSQIIDTRPAIRVVFDEPIVPGSIFPDSFTLYAEGNLVSGVVEHRVVRDKSVFHYYPAQPLAPHTTYTVKVGGLKDAAENTIEPIEWKFTVRDEPFAQLTMIDNFDALTNWWSPDQSGSSTGYDPVFTSRNVNQNLTQKSLITSGSLQVNYGWNLSSPPHYIRLYLPPTAAQNDQKFNATHHLQVYMYGDGSGNQFRFMIRDGQNHLEGSPWVTIDWIGWKLVSWDLANEPATGWVNGNGLLEGTGFFMDGFHFRYVDGAATIGNLYFEDLRFVSPGTRQFPTAMTESFEGYADFTTDIFPWITQDVKGDITWNPQGFSFPGSGQPFAFKVMNPALTSGPIQEQHPAQDGEKYLIAMQSQTVDDDKWLISEQFRANEFTTLSFYAKSISDAWGLERFQVLVSEDAGDAFVFQPENFTQVSEGAYTEAPLEWTRFTYDLSALDGQVFRFAVRGVSHDSYMLMLDNFVVSDEEEEEEVVVGLPMAREISARVYPNPSSGMVHVQADSPIRQIQVMAVSGKWVINHPGSTDQESVNLSQLPEGMYLIRVITTQGMYTGKIILKR
jgi:N-acetylmuramoyl-L-alanine amidase